MDNLEILYKLFGNLDENLMRIENVFKVKIASREGEIIIIGEEHTVLVVEKLMDALVGAIRSGEVLDRQKLEYFITAIRDGEGDKLSSLSESILVVTSKGKFVKPKTLGQQKYVRAIQKNDVTFGVGPAGTGKTYLAVAMAVKAFKNDEVSRIVITRPAVEAGESLGFLPGDLQMKVDPYLRPLYDALYDILGTETYLKYKERGMIEVAPLAYMRGRTLDNSFIILDEAQNTTIEQMKMFLTRFGFGSKVVVNGDITQIDLPSGKRSGFVHAIEVLKNVEEIALVEFTDKDVVRHSLVRRIIQEYDKYEKHQKIKDEARIERKSRPRTPGSH
jgi:phosphate starvation-inducible PhoH-like protein